MESSLLVSEMFAFQVISRNLSKKDTCSTDSTLETQSACIEKALRDTLKEQYETGGYELSIEGSKQNFILCLEFQLYFVFNVIKCSTHPCPTRLLV